MKKIELNGDYNKLLFFTQKTLKIDGSEWGVYLQILL